MIRRWWLPLALLLSLGVNLGVVAMLALRGGSAAESDPPAAGAMPRGEPGRPGPQAPGRRFEELARQLRLDPEASRRFVALQSRHFEAARDVRRRLEDARRALASEFLTGAADRARVEALLGEIESAQADLDKTLADLMLESQQILTPEQQRRFAFFVLERLRNAGQPPPARGPLRRLFERRAPPR